MSSAINNFQVITVGALAHWDYIHQNSNWGKCVDIFAPGQNVRSAWYISTVDNDTLSGTSMSASHVTGTVLPLIIPHLTHRGVSSSILDPSYSFNCGRSTRTNEPMISFIPSHPIPCNPQHSSPLWQAVLRFNSQFFLSAITVYLCRIHFNLSEIELDLSKMYST